MPDDYDELSLLADNAAEVGLALDGLPPVARREVPLAGVGHLSALVWGAEPPEAVLLHGAAQNAHTWDTVALALGSPLVALDLPGHGHSSWREDHDYSPAVLADPVAAGIEALAPAARLVVGMSLGGLTALALSARRPELVRRLVLVDITPGVNPDKGRAVTEFVSGPERFASFDEILDRTIRHHPTRTESSLRRGVLHNTHRLDDGSWSWRWDPERRTGVAGADFGALWDAVSSLAVPLTLVRGELSPVVDDEDVRELRRRQPGAEVVVVEGAGHSVQGDRPLELAEILAGVLAAG